MKVIRITLFLLAFIVILTSATIKITYPSSVFYWVVGEQNEIRWTSEASDPPKFAVYLNNQNLGISKYYLLNDISTSFGNVTLPGTSLTGTGFQLVFADTLDTNTNISTSEFFEVKPLGTTPTSYVSPTPTPSSSSSAGPTGSTSANPSASPTTSNSNSIHSSTLVLITLFIIALF